MAGQELHWGLAVVAWQPGRYPDPGITAGQKLYCTWCQQCSCLGPQWTWQWSGSPGAVLALAVDKDAGLRSHTRVGTGLGGIWDSHPTNGSGGCPPGVGKDPGHRSHARICESPPPFPRRAVRVIPSDGGRDSPCNFCGPVLVLLLFHQFNFWLQFKKHKAPCWQPVSREATPNDHVHYLLCR